MTRSLLKLLEEDDTYSCASCYLSWCETAGEVGSPGGEEGQLVASAASEQVEAVITINRN